MAAGERFIIFGVTVSVLVTAILFFIHCYQFYPMLHVKAQIRIQGSAIEADQKLLLYNASDIYVGGHQEVASKVCQNKGLELTLLIVVISAPNHFKERMAIRQTWGHFGMRSDMAVGFLIGAVDDKNLQEKIKEEIQIYGDVIQSNTFDSYYNLTLKTISMLEWVKKFCQSAQLILKTDDDVFINVPKLIEIINKLKNKTRTIYGRLAKQWKPFRSFKSKYYISPKHYGSFYFPQFATGPAYLMTSDAVDDLYKAALNMTYMKLEDVYITGIAAERANISLVRVREFINERVTFHPCLIKKVVSIHSVKDKEQFWLWSKLMSSTYDCRFGFWNFKAWFLKFSK